MSQSAAPGSPAKLVSELPTNRSETSDPWPPIQASVCGRN